MAKHNYWAKLEPNQCYHIYNHTVGTEDLFKQPRNYDYFLSKWEKYISPYFVNYAFCLMSNHFHFLSKAKPMTGKLRNKIEQDGTKRGLAFLSGDVPVSRFYESQFASLFKSYTNAINKQEKNRFGGLFKAKFRRTLVKDKKDFLHFLCYVHHNPIHHNVAGNYEEWKYSSYGVYLNQYQVSDTSKVSDTSSSKVSDTSSYPPLSIATNATLKIFKTKDDTSGIKGFVAEHERFKMQ